MTMYARLAKVMNTRQHGATRRTGARIVEVRARERAAADLQVQQTVISCYVEGITAIEKAYEAGIKAGQASVFAGADEGVVN